ncbi:MAG: alpha/beta hydrolase family protein [Bacteroidales bacterium]
MSGKTVLRKVIPVLFVFLIILYSCEKERNNTNPEPEYLVESELLYEYTTTEILNLLSSNAEFPQEIIQIAENLVQNGISAYRVVYETVDINNDPILASGAVVVPTGSSPYPAISFQHGTLNSDEDAPSYFSSNTYLPAMVYASAGFIIILPDYLGYGVSNHIDHPYEHGKSLATASRDMLRAFKEFDLLDDGFQAGEKLFLTGYSEGGYATMALLKLLEEEHSNEFKVTAATAGAGAYNKTAFAKHIMESNTRLTYINSFLWVLDTYNNIYGLNRPYNHFFNEPYAGTIEAGGVFANTQRNPSILFTDEFRSGILQGTDSQFLNVLADNDNYDWKPVTPLRLYHGTDDDYVFYFNSVTAYDAMKERGSSSVSFSSIQGGNHNTSLFDYFTGSLLFFSAF